MGWFEQNPNKTYIIGYIMTVYVYFIYSNIIASVLMICISAKILTWKNRNWTWLFLSGLFAPLWLENHGKQSKYYQNKLKTQKENDELKIFEYNERKKLRDLIEK